MYPNPTYRDGIQIFPGLLRPYRIPSPLASGGLDTPRLDSHHVGSPSLHHIHYSASHPQQATQANHENHARNQNHDTVKSLGHLTKMLFSINRELMKIQLHRC